MDTESMDAGRAHGWQIALAVSAFVAILPWLAMGVENTFVLFVFVLCGLPLAAPLLVLRRREEFVRICIGVASTSIFWVVFGCMLGTVVLLPSAVLLFLAAGADPRRRPVKARFLGGVGALLAAAAVIGPTMLIWEVLVASE
ncbi:hypothetical protein [Streptomyces xanthochromogenes]|uniref:hypothetical protein n=1 Tax=Streptomyces xanthochromogenes TaxID=67384 RepID=UPI001E5D297A|nr:hypothetical protein [Streptomyces xanthochromogenes]